MRWPEPRAPAAACRSLLIPPPSPGLPASLAAIQRAHILNPAHHFRFVAGGRDELSLPARFGREPALPRFLNIIAHQRSNNLSRRPVLCLDRRRKLRLEFAVDTQVKGRLPESGLSLGHKHFSCIHIVIRLCNYIKNLQNPF